MDFSKRIVGYGAWNLHFDRLRGTTSTSDGLTFLRYLRALAYYEVNHIKIILFRNSIVEGLPAGRSYPLYSGGAINQLLIDNTKKLIEEAAATGFWVQVCVWHHHAIATEDKSEFPENAPSVLTPEWAATPDGKRLSHYYSPTLSKPGAFDKAAQLFRRVGKEFGAYDNVLFELGNELRVWETDGTDAGRIADERNLRSWLATMMSELRAGAAAVTPRQLRVCVSTGKNNESLMFNPADGGLNVDFFDFHAGQWGMTLKTDTGYPAGIQAARARVDRYKPGAKLLINTDGLFKPETFQTSYDFSLYMEKWATEAFAHQTAHDSFVTKGYYPPGVAESRPMLDALELASRHVPQA